VVFLTENKLTPLGKTDWLLSRGASFVYSLDIIGKPVNIQ